MLTSGARGTVAARSFAALSGIAILGTLAGCSAQSLAATVTGPKPAATSVALPAKATPSATPTRSASDTSTPAAVPTAASKVPTPTKTTTPASTASASPNPTPSPSASAASSSTYADGNYSATGTYTSPGGRETLRVTLDLANDVVTDLAVTSVHVDSTAANYEAAFEGGIQAIVVGKDIDSLSVGAVAGSSLTANGFNRAIATIKGLAAN
jgi:hypothetical protein